MKWRIVVKHEPLFALAGLWEWWRDRGTPDAHAVHSYTIITTQPNTVMAPIHDRMPVIIAPRDYARWLDPTQRVDDLLAPLPDDAIQVIAS